MMTEMLLLAQMRFIQNKENIDIKIATKFILIEMRKVEGIHKRASMWKRIKDTGQKTYHNNKNPKLHRDIKTTGIMITINIQEETKESKDDFMQIFRI